MPDRKTDKSRTPDQMVSLNFLIHRDFRRRFKRRAVDADVTQKELLYQAFEAWEEKHGFKKKAKSG